MIIIKRYSNRKLYNTNQKEYITLEQITALVRQGVNIQVIEHDTGEDITAVTLAQIIFEHEKKGQSILSQGILTRVIQAGEETLNHWKRKVLDRFNLGEQVNHIIDRRLEYLTKENLITPAEAEKWRELLINRIPDELTDHMELNFEPVNVPTKDEVSALTEQVEHLTQVLDEIYQKLPKSQGE